MTRRTIFVTQNNIDSGLTESPDQCPIALACRDAGLELWIGCVNAYFSQEAYKGRDQDCPGQFSELPDSAKTFIADFDEGKEVEAFEFDLDISGSDLTPGPDRVSDSQGL